MYSKGIMWLDDCRIPFVDEVRTIPVHSEDKKTDETLFGLHPTIQHKREITTQGRFTPNLLVCDDMLNDGRVGGGGSYSGIKKRTRIRYFDVRDTMDNEANSPDNYGDKGTNSRYYDLDLWFDKMLEGL